MEEVEHALDFLVYWLEDRRERLRCRCEEAMKARRLYYKNQGPGHPDYDRIAASITAWQDERALLGQLLKTVENGLADKTLRR